MLHADDVIATAAVAAAAAAGLLAKIDRQLVMLVCGRVYDIQPCQLAVELGLSPATSLLSAVVTS